MKFERPEDFEEGKSYELTKPIYICSVDDTFIGENIYGDPVEDPLELLSYNFKQKEDMIIAPVGTKIFVLHNIRPYPEIKFNDYLIMPIQVTEDLGIYAKEVE